MPRASARRRLRAEITSSPLPSAKRMSTTAKAGGLCSTWRRPSATLSAVVTLKPRVSIARANLARNSLSSSTINSERSPVGIAAAGSVIVCCSLDGTRQTPWAGPPEWRDLPSGEPDLGRFAAFSRGRFLGAGRRSLKIRPGPAHPHDRPGLRGRPVGNGQGCTRALQQGLGDEKTETQAHGIAVGRARAHAAGGHVGLADAIHDLGRKPGPIVGNGDGDLMAGPAHCDLDARTGKVDCILDQVAEPVQDAGVAR